MNQELPVLARLDSPALGRSGGGLEIVEDRNRRASARPRKEVARALLPAVPCCREMPAPNFDLVAVALDRAWSFVKHPAHPARIVGGLLKFCRLSPVNFGYSYNKRLWNHRRLLHLARCSFPAPKSPPLEFASVKEVSHPAPSRGYGISLGSRKNLVHAEVTPRPAACEVLVLQRINRPRAAA